MIALKVVSQYYGPSLLAPVPALRARMTPGEGESWASAHDIPGSLDPLDAVLSQFGLRHQLLGDRREPAEIEADKNGEFIGSVIAHLTLGLQLLAGQSVAFSSVAGSETSDAIQIGVEYRLLTTGTAALNTAFAIVAAHLPPDIARGIKLPPGFDSADAVQKFLEGARTRGLDITTSAIVDAAEARGIPWSQLDPRDRPVVLGHGQHRRILIEDVSDRESLLATRFASNKMLTSKYLGELGLPVAPSAEVADLQNAVAAADRLGYPVVTKPNGRGKGRGVVIGIKNGEELATAFIKSKEHAPTIIVEKFVEGEDHRLLVVGGEFIAGARRIPGSVVGDGTKTVQTLVAEINEDPRRGVGFQNYLVRLELDALAIATMKENGYSANSVPGPGECVALRKTANISTGGTAIDVTEIIHPDNRRAAEHAARGLGLDVAGVDFLSTDISRSYLEIGGAICEVNQSPGLRPHWVAEGKPPDVVTPILDHLFPGNIDGRIPIAAVTGTNGKTTTSGMLAHIIQSAGKTVGWASTIGVSIDGHRLRKGDLAGPPGAKMVLNNPATEFAVLEVARGALIRRGLPFRQSDVGALTNISSDHLGEYGIETIEDMLKAKRLVVDYAKFGVLNADDPLCLSVVEGRAADSIYLVSLDDENPAVAQHRAQSGRAAILDNQGKTPTLVICQGEVQTPIIAVEDVPAAFGGAARHNIANALFAAAMADALGLGADDIRNGLESFAFSHEMLPGRSNLFDGHPFTVILDYAHNPAAFAAVGDMMQGLANGGARRCVFTSPGNRDDANLRTVAETLAPRFDHFVCRQGVLFDRKPGEVPEKLRDALIDLGISEDRITIVVEEEAVATALQMAEPGDALFVMMSLNPANRFWEQIVNFQSQSR